MKISNITGTACEGCKHLEVCKFTEEFITAQQAVDEASIPVRIEEESLGKIGSRPISYIDYIEPIKLKCKNAEYKPKFNTRDAASAASSST